MIVIVETVLRRLMVITNTDVDRDSLEDSSDVDRSTLEDSSEDNVSVVGHCIYWATEAVQVEVMAARSELTI